MIPASLSATSLDVASKCLARWAAENYGKATSGADKTAANLGTAVHGALELYVRSTYMNHTNEPDLELLLTLFSMQFMAVFDVADPQGELYLDGIDMLTRWFDRTDLSGITVISVENKEPFNIPVKDAAGTLHNIPFNYVFDRLDQISETEYRVVDYKSVRWGYGPDELLAKLQARAYAVAAQIKYPHATRIWVQFDLLRHDAVGIVFTREQNAATYRYIRTWAKKILDTDPALAPETVNDECRWCIRKAVCQELSKSRSAGAITTLPIPELVDRRALISGQISALKALEKELDDHLKELAKKDDLEVLASDRNEVYWTRTKRRGISRVDALEKIVGPAIMARIGKTDITLGKLDPLLKKNNPELTTDQKKQIEGLFTDNYGEPYLKVRPVNKFDA